MASEKFQKLSSIEGLEPATKYPRSMFMAGGKGDDLWRAQMTSYAEEVHDEILCDADHMVELWREKRTAKAAEKAAKKAAKLRAKADEIEADARAVAE
ncbi:MAG: hypothetical protein WC374_12840 [Phycisphaerae bacterium]|jgi:hypothetical protein